MTDREVLERAEEALVELETGYHRMTRREVRDRLRAIRGLVDHVRRRL